MNSRRLALAASISTGLAAPIIGGFVIGYFLDRWLNSSPWLVLILGMLGTAGGFIALYRTVNRMNQEREEE